jgi:classical protein kinase C/novel protein kinase C epsilon type
MRKPLTGHLTLRVHAVRDVDHAASSRFSRGPETFVVVKVEDAVKARTRATRTDNWTEENFNIDIDKANEIELTVYDKSGDRPNPIGMLWIRISDIAEEMRRKKIESDLTANGWVSAETMAQGSGRQDLNHQTNQFGQPGGQRPGTQGQPYGHTAATADAAAGPGPVVIDTWFALEPVGRIHLTMSFGMCLQMSTEKALLTTISQTNEGSTSV